jgi:hypothetical protein
MPFRLGFSVLLVLLAAVVRAEAQFTPPPAITPAEDFNVELALMWWQPEPALTLTTGDVRVGTVDFVQEFGLGEKRFREFRATLKPGRKHKLRFSHVPIKYDQDAVLQREVVIENVAFPPGTNANADINWDVYRFGYEWDFVSREHGFIGLVTELKYNRVKAEVTGTASAFGQTQTFDVAVDQTAPVPTIGAIARGYLGQYVSVTGEFTALKVDREAFRGKVYDFEIYGAAHLGKFVGVQVGYRSLDVDYRVDEDEGTMTMKGPYFGGFIRF